MPPRSVALVTGASGFVGRHVVRTFSDEGFAVRGVGREAIEASGIDYEQIDLTRGWPSVDDVSVIVHLAGMAAVGASFDSPQRYIDTTSRMMTGLGERLISTGSRARVLVISTGAVYAARPQTRISESTPTHATSPYAVSKLVLESQADYYRSRGADIVVVRPFNHIGPGQEGGFLVPDLATTALESARTGNAMLVGDLSTARDYTDVRDVASAYLSIATTPRLHSTVYNVCSGTARSGWEIWRIMAHLLGVDESRATPDSRRFRPTEVPEIVGDSSRLRQETGWTPSIDLERSITDYLDELSQNDQSSPG